MDATSVIDVDSPSVIFHYASPMSEPLLLIAGVPWVRAVEKTTELLGRLRLDHAFVSGVARAAWLREPLAGGAVDVLAVMAPQQKSQVGMMAMNRGFEVDRDAVEAADELDLIPLALTTDGVTVRIHVLVASNALYAKMVSAAVAARIGESEIRVVAAEDLALMMLVAGAEASEIATLARSAEQRFDRDALNAKLVAIGLSHKVVRT